MVVRAKLVRIDPPFAGHAQVEDHGVPAIRVDEAVFRAAVEPGHPRACQSLPEVGRKRPPQVQPALLDALDRSALEDLGKAPNRRFNFGQLRHSPDMAARRQAR